MIVLLLQASLSVNELLQSKPKAHNFSLWDLSHIQLMTICSLAETKRDQQRRGNWPSADLGMGRTQAVKEWQFAD